MPKLFELYVLGMLKDKYFNSIKFQETIVIVDENSINIYGCYQAQGLGHNKKIKQLWKSR